MTGNTDPPGIQLLGEFRENSLRQLFRNIGIHVVARVVRCLTRIDVETRAGAEIVRVCFAGDV